MTDSALDLENGRVELGHGGGGRAMARLVDELFRAHLDNPFLAEGNDFGAFDVPGGRMVMSTDGHVIQPLFFPGGDIGSLAVHGTINDVSMAGARPLYLALGLVLEEGLPLRDLAAVVESVGRAARAAGVPVVTGDTKVVERGKADGLYITTTGVGLVPPGVEVGGANARPGDAVVLSGPIGEHGVAVLSRREGLGFESDVVSDSAPLHGLVSRMVEAVPELRCLRDPTRGGVAAALNEIAQQSGVGMLLRESAIPVRAPVRGACELLGLDPLHVANEGRLVAVCPPGRVDALLATMQTHPLGRDAVRIGEMVHDDHGFVELETAYGGRHLVDWLSGEALPRIC